MTTKTYDTIDELPDLNQEKKYQSVDDLPDLKKKGGGLSLKSGGGLNVTPITPLQLDVEGIFNFQKIRDKKAPLKANLRDVDTQALAFAVATGSIEGDELSNAYENVFGKPIVERVMAEYAPDMGGYGWSKDVFRNEQKWDELAKRIKTKNRVNAKATNNDYLASVDKEIQNAVANYSTQKVIVSGGTGGAAASVTNIPFPDININNPYDYGRVIEQLQDADVIVDKSGKQVPGAKQRLIAALEEKANSFVQNNGIDNDIESLTPKITETIARANIDREKGEDISVDDFAKDDKTNEQHFKLGLSYVKIAKPGQYKNVVNIIEAGKSVPGSDFSIISQIGQNIYNSQVFFGAADNPELIDKETNLDYTTREDKKALYASIIGERLKQAGGKNRREFTEDEIKKAAFDLPNKNIVQELANEEKIFGYDAIPKSGWREAIVQGVMQPIDGIRSTFQSFSESPVDTYIRSKKLDTGSAQKVIGPDGEVSEILPSDRGNIWYDALRGFGQFIPQILLARGIGGATASVIGADARIAMTPALRAGITNYGGTAVSTFLQTYGDSYADYLDKTGGDVATARLAGTVDGGVSAAFELLLPDTKIADRAFRGLKGELVNDIVSLARKGGDPADIAKTGRSFVEKFVKGSINISGQEIAEEVGTQLVDYITESVFSPQTAKDRDVGNELLETVKQTAVAMAIPSVFGAAGAGLNKDFSKNVFNSAAINLLSYKQTLDRALDNGSMKQDEYNQIISLLKTHSESINNAPRQDSNGDNISNQQQLDYAFEETKIKTYKQKADNSSGVAKEMWEGKIKQSEEIQRSILMPSIKEGDINKPKTEENARLQESQKRGEKTGDTQEIQPEGDGLTEGEGQVRQEILAGQEGAAEGAVPSLNEKEIAAIEGLNKKDFSNVGLFMQTTTDVLKNKNATPQQKREALKSISDQLLAKGTEAATGEILGKEADLVYDLGYEAPTESKELAEVVQQQSELTPEEITAKINEVDAIRETELKSALKPNVDLDIDGITEDAMVLHPDRVNIIMKKEGLKKQADNLKSLVECVYG